MMNVRLKLSPSLAGGDEGCGFDVIEVREILCDEQEHTRLYLERMRACGWKSKPNGSVDYHTPSKFIQPATENYDGLFATEIRV